MMQTQMRTVLLLVLFVAVGKAAPAAEQVSDPTDLSFLERVQVSVVIDGDTFGLADGREVRLTGIQAPKLPLGRPNFTEWPLAREAKQALQDLALGEWVALYGDENTEDRYRRILAHGVRDDGVWLQGAMVERGMARVYTFADNRRMAHALYGLEQKARQARHGLWALRHYAIRSSRPDELSEDVGTFQVVEGRVVDAAKVRSRIYLNFGDNYRTDFTASIDRSVWSLFDDTGRDALMFEGQSIRVRGWIKDFNGPLIDITHPEQIESVTEQVSRN